MAAISLEEREQAFAKRFNSKFIGFEYIEGYVHSECKVTVRHKRCGTLLVKSANLVRHKESISCKQCDSIKRDYLKNIREELDVLNRNKIKIYKLIAKMKTRLEGLSNSLKMCPECGKEFVSNKRKFCSERCSRKREFRVHKLKREKRLRNNGPIEYSITLEKLAIRDKYKCHLCNRKVNMNVHYNDDPYGSIDHLVPIAKGGTHTWNNIKLAHRKCNSIKSDKLYSQESGQLKMFL